jgi:hypothetical protein
MKTWHVIAGVAVPAALGILFLQRSSDEKLARFRKDLDALRAETAAAAAEPGVDAERAQGAARVTFPTDPIPVVATTTAPDPKARAASEAPAKDAGNGRSWTGQELSDAYAVEFTTEAEDAEWATKARRTATERLKADLPPSSELRAVDCRTSMCRIETSHVDRQSFHEFARKAFGDPSTGVWNGGSFSGIVSGGDESGGPLIVVSYLAREGKELTASDFNEPQ